MMNNYVARTYYTMDDVGISTKSLADSSVAHGKESSVITLVGYVMKRYRSNWIIYEDVDFIGGTKPDEPQIDPDKVERWLERFGYTIDTTFDRYNKLIELYNQEKDNLLNRVGSKQTTKFNDTPQEQNVPTDGFTSTITTHTAEIDPGETINRLKNIDNNFVDLYRDWVKEFAYLFGVSL